MASPQPTPFVRFSKELYEAFYQNPPATVAACRLWLWVLRYTYGHFGQAETPPRSFRQISAEVGVSKGTACRELQALVRCRRLKVGDQGGYAVQKDYDLWRDDTKKRELHYGNKLKQEALFPTEKKLSTDLSTVSNGRTISVSHGRTISFPTVKSSVSPYRTPIGKKTPVENSLEGKKSGQILPNGLADTARNRAALGHGSYDPADHPGFARLSYKIQDDLVATWKDAREKERAATACRNKCGRLKEGEWPFCRACTVCSSCGKGLDGRRKFTYAAGVLTCSTCKTDS